MGSIVSKSMEESMKKNQEFMVLTQRAQLERQMHMQNAMREQQIAIQIARSRDFFKWWGSFYLAYVAASVIGIRKYGRKEIAAPLLPLTFILGYLGDTAYGSKMKKIKEEAKRILEEEKDLIDLPVPLPSFEELDRRRNANDSNK